MYVLKYLLRIFKNSKFVHFFIFENNLFGQTDSPTDFYFKKLKNILLEKLKIFKINKVLLKFYIILYKYI
jgi:hypothetical protein